MVDAMPQDDPFSNKFIKPLMFSLDSSIEKITSEVTTEVFCYFDNVLGRSLCMYDF